MPEGTPSLSAALHLQSSSAIRHRSRQTRGQLASFLDTTGHALLSIVNASYHPSSEAWGRSLVTRQATQVGSLMLVTTRTSNCRRTSGGREGKDRGGGLFYQLELMNLVGE